jgi:hypothetical protein
VRCPARVGLQKSVRRSRSQREGGSCSELGGWCQVDRGVPSDGSKHRYGIQNTKLLSLLFSLELCAAIRDHSVHGVEDKEREGGRRGRYLAGAGEEAAQRTQPREGPGSAHLTDGMGLGCFKYIHSTARDTHQAVGVVFPELNCSCEARAADERANLPFDSLVL